MSCILYYSKYCENSKRLLQNLSKSNVSKDIHFVCVDKRVKEANGKIYILFENGQKMLLPENITKIPALLLLNQNYNVLYGDDIQKYFKPKEETQVRVATKNNMTPMPQSLEPFSGFGGYGIVSDNYSFLDQSDSDLGTSGNGGLRQMHNYVALNDNQLMMHLPQDDTEYKSNKLKNGDISMESLQKQRDDELAGIDMRQQMKR
jgi:hypothetical protein